MCGCDLLNPLSRQQGLCCVVGNKQIGRRFIASR